MSMPDCPGSFIKTLPKESPSASSAAILNHWLSLSSDQGSFSLKLSPLMCSTIAALAGMGASGFLEQELKVTKTKANRPR